MLRRTRATLAVASGLCLLVGLSHAQTAPGAGQLPAQQPAVRPITDRDFVAKAAVGGSTEVALAKLALQNASRAEVRTFAQQMIDDHTNANQQLLTLAGRKQMAVPRTLDEKHQAAVDRLSRLQGEAFDRSYAQQMVADHVETVQLFRDESSGGQDAELKGLAGKLLPTLEMHLTMARRLSTEVNGGATGGAVDGTRKPSAPRR